MTNRTRWTRESLLLCGLLALSGGGCSDEATPSSDAAIDHAHTHADGASTPADGDIASDTARPDDSATQDSGGSGLYTPDNGPSHVGGTVVAVSSVAEILSAIANASPGDVITVAPGTYDFSQVINVENDGQADSRIFLRAEREGTVTFNLTHIENFKITAKFWVFENITFFGNCTASEGCEHAFHIVADADDLIFRNNEVVNFASHVKLNGEVIGAGPAKAFPDRTWFIDNFWHNTKYVPNDVPHNILNLDGGKDHVVRGNIFADYAASPSLPRSASAVYPKASTTGILIEQNLIVCENARTTGETTRGIQLGDGAPATICDGDDDEDGSGDCVENGQNQEGLVRNNIVMNCDNGGSSAGIMINSDRHSEVLHNSVYGTGPRNAVFYQGHASFDTYFQFNILEDGFDTTFANRPVNATDNLEPDNATMNTMFANPDAGNFAVTRGSAILDQSPTDADAPHDFCGYPRGDQADRGAIEFSTTHGGTPCETIIQQMFDRIPGGS